MGRIWYKYFYDVNTSARSTTALLHTSSTMTIKDIKDIQTLLSIEHNEGSMPSLAEILTDLNIDPNTRTVSGLRTTSKFTPLIPRDYAIDSFCNRVTSDLYRMEEQYVLGHKSIHAHNISSAEKRALVALGSCKDIVIKEADKGLLCSFNLGTGSFLSFLVPPGSWFCRARKERGVLFNFHAIRASHTPHTPTNVARKRQGSRSFERNRNTDLGRAPRSHLLAGPSGACRHGPDPSRGRQKAVKRLQRSVLQAHGIRGIRGFHG
ncbi:hypothetical protein NDU88_004955 [Pleurodeles waltl]|uniref:Uncharacterized protein n=1 Tax=Pleurodeles waltl TaxID=8319 RepID=A0AAV7MI22_PLEWA|nr:hypothetical protein NDU88_004955 [Pleurodeles waltl]